METNTWYVYNVDTRQVVDSVEGTEAEALALYSNFDSDLYALTCTPAFGTTDGLIE